MNTLDMGARLSALLAKIPPAAPPTIFGCATCEDTKWVEVERRMHRCQDCRRDFRELVDGTPDALRDVTLETIGVDQENRAALGVVREVIEGRSSDERHDLVLFGTTGTGKTHAAAAALNSRCQRRHVAGLMVKSLELLRRLQPGPDEDARASFHSRLMSVPVLLVDDLGAEQPTDYARRTLFEIYEVRHDRRLMTITTTNLDLDGLAQLFDDDRLTSRLAGWARVIPMKGQDRRLRRPTRAFSGRRAEVA